MSAWDKCKECGKEIGWQGANNYGIFCSAVCARKDQIKREKQEGA